MKQFSHVKLYLFFLIFLYKKVATPHHLPKKKGALKSTQISFFERHQVCSPSQWWLRWECRELSFVLDLNDQMCTLVFAWSCMILLLFLFFFCLLRYCMIFCCMYCLLRTFLNCHSVCHQNNKYVCTPFNNNAVVVTMDHRSSLDSGT